MAWVQAARSRRKVGTGRWAGAEFIVLSEEEENDQNKTLTYNTDILDKFPNSVAAELLWIYFEYTATAAGSARRVFYQLNDSESDGIGGIGVENTLVAGATTSTMVGRSLEQNAAINTPDHERLAESLILLPGMNLNTAEFSGNAAAGDDYIVHIALAVYS